MAVGIYIHMVQPSSACGPFRNIDCSGIEVDQDGPYSICKIYDYIVVSIQNSPELVQRVRIQPRGCEIVVYGSAVRNVNELLSRHHRSSHSLISITMIDSNIYFSIPVTVHSWKHSSGICCHGNLGGHHLPDIFRHNFQKSLSWPKKRGAGQRQRAKSRNQTKIQTGGSSAASQTTEKDLEQKIVQVLKDWTEQEDQ